MARRGEEQAVPGEVRRDSPLPLYHQLKLILVRRIERGEWRPGDLIPGEQDLQDMYKISRTTVRQALRELELEGLVTRYRGRGTFVARPKLSHGPRPGDNLVDFLRARGMTPGWRVLSVERVLAPDDVATALELPARATVTRIRRLRLADDQAIGYQEAHVAPLVKGPFLSETLTTGGSLDYLRAKGVIDRSHLERVLEAIPADPELSALLEVQLGAPLLRIRRVLYSADAKPIEVMEGTYRGDRFQYRVSTGGS